MTIFQRFQDINFTPSVFVCEIYYSNLLNFARNQDVWNFNSICVYLTWVQWKRIFNSFNGLVGELLITFFSNDIMNWYFYIFIVLKFCFHCYWRYKNIGCLKGNVLMKIIINIIIIFGIDPLILKIDRVDDLLMYRTRKGQIVNSA